MRPIRESFVLSLLLAPAAGEVAGQEPERTLQIARAARPPELDDFVRGDSARPGEAVVSDYRQRDPGDGNPAGAPTMAYLSYDDANLYVVFVCRDRPALVRAGLAKREEIASDDGVALYLDTFGDRKHAYLFAANPLGVQADALVTEGQDDDYSFDAVWQADGRVTADGYVLRFALTLDATLNPDFSQVESDEPQVTINERFETFFPEKRPFFIENAGYFQTPVNLLFSRRIADPGEGVRLTGKAGRWGIGAIGIDDRAPARTFGIDEAGIAAVRIERELGRQSAVGVLGSNRTLGGAWNRVVSADTRLALSKTWVFTGQAIATTTRDSTGAGASGTGWYANLLRDGRNLDYSATYLDLSPAFETQLGFVKRVGIREFEQQIELVRRPHGPVVKVGPTLTAQFDWDRDGRLLDRSLEASLEVKLRGETKLVVAREQAFELFDDLSFDTYQTKLTLESEWLKWLAGSAQLKLGTAVNHKPPKGTDPSLGDAVQGELGFTFRPAPQFRIDHTFLYERLATRLGAPVFTDRILREKVNYQFTRALSLRAIVDYAIVRRDSTQSRVDPEHRWGVDVLLTYLVNPGTALYVGYRDGYENLAILPGTPPALYRTDDPTTSVGRQVFLKLSYLLQF